MYRWERNEFPCVPSMFWGILGIHQETEYALSCAGVKADLAYHRQTYSSMYSLGDAGVKVSRRDCQPSPTQGVKGHRHMQHNLELYRRRQMIVEHPLGAIKRSMNDYYFLLRTIKKVRSEVALLFFAYNLKRVQNILGQQELMKRLASLLLCLSSCRDKMAATLASLFRGGNNYTQCHTACHPFCSRVCRT